MDLSNGLRNRIMMIRRLAKDGRGSSLVGALLAITVFSAAHADTGTDWLVSTQGPNGAYSSDTDIATPFQATAETLRTFDQVDQALRNTERRL